MDLGELEALLDEVRNGRDEDTATEWKDRWWDFKVPKSRDEFVKDVAAMANANTKDPRVIVVGVGRGGVPNNAPLPEDEAHLQQRLQTISPTPNILFKTLTLPDGKVLSVIEVQEPFDKPYVAKIENRNVIFVRQGSSTTTATRAMLDRWYQQKATPPDLALVLDGDAVAGGQTITFERELLVAEPEPEWSGIRVAPPRIMRAASLEDRVRQQNHVFWLELDIANQGSTAGEDIIVDFEIVGVREVALYKRDLELPSGLVADLIGARPSWATDPSEACYVDRHWTDGNVGHARQRLRRVNPGGTERLVSLGLLADVVPDGDPLRFEVKFDVLDGSGSRVEGQFSIDVQFVGERVVPRGDENAKLGV